MKLKNFWEIKAIDEARAKKIIEWYEKANYRIGFMASSKGQEYGSEKKGFI